MMRRWPWVARDLVTALERQVTGLRFDLQVAADDRRGLLDRLDRLVQQLVDLKRDGFNLPLATEPELPPPAPLPLVVEEALTELGLPPRERAREELRCREWLAAGREPRQVVHALIEGESDG